MAQFYIGRNPGAPDVVEGHTAQYLYDTVTEVVSMVDVPVSQTESFPTPGSVIYQECDGADLITYTYVSGNSLGSPIVITKTTYPNAADCCSINSADVTVEIGVDDGSDNGSITLSSDVIDLDLYEASLDGAAYVPGSGGTIQFTGLEGTTEGVEREVRLRLIGGACFVTYDVIVPLKEIETPFAFDLNTPDAFMPVFYPIAYTGQFSGNEVDITQNGAYTVIETSSAAIQDYLATLPEIRVYDSENYPAVYSVLQRLNTTQFVINAEYATDETVKICPAGKQLFYLYCERTVNQFIRIAEILCAADEDGVFNIRVEGFLQSEFIVNPPVPGIEITLGRKYYLIAPNFSVTTSPTTAVYSAIESLVPYLEDLVPLGPAPMNFISTQTQKGLPVLFSYLDATLGRVYNNISSHQTEITSVNDIELAALPCNSYDITWIKVAGNINGTLVSDPALPDWISVVVDGDRIYLTIDTCPNGSDVDYSPDDYDSDDYLTAGFNELVGCYEFTFSDDDGELFTLSICIYPIQQPAQSVCPDDAFNIAWVNRQGGWSSYAFASDRGDKSKKIRGYDVGSSTDFKQSGELKKSSVEDVYQTAVVMFSNKNQRDLEFIASLRKSIQAYLFNDQTQAWDIPIFIDVESFPTYSVPFNQAADGNGQFTFRYSDEIRIQRQ